MYLLADVKHAIVPLNQIIKDSFHRTIQPSKNNTDCLKNGNRRMNN
jgi:hypothetical protein